MAIVERYVTNAGAGLHDGTSLANAWSWAEMLVNLAAGQRANINGNITVSTAADTFSNNGTIASPIWIRFYNSTIGDLESNGVVDGRNADGTLDVTNFPTVTCTASTYTLTLPSYVICEHGYFDFSASTASNTLQTGSYATLRRCYVESATTAAIISLGQHCIADTVDSHNSALAPSVANTYCFNANRNVLFYNCRATSDVSTIQGFRMSATWNSRAIKCQAIDVDVPFYVSTINALIVDCSALNFTDFISVASSSILKVIGCVAWGTGKFIDDNGSARGLLIDTNAYGNTAADTITGDYLINQNRITLLVSPFTSSTNLSLNDAATGGELCKNASISGGGQDLGAIQSAVEAGGGSGWTPRTIVI